MVRRDTTTEIVFGYDRLDREMIALIRNTVQVIDPTGKSVRQITGQDACEFVTQNHGVVSAGSMEEHLQALQKEYERWVAIQDEGVESDKLDAVIDSLERRIRKLERYIAKRKVHAQQIIRRFQKLMAL